MARIKRIYKRIILLAAVIIFFGSIGLVLTLSGKIQTEISDGSAKIGMYYLGKKPMSETQIYDLSLYEIILIEGYFEDLYGKGEKIDGASLVRVESGNYDSEILGRYALYCYKNVKSRIILKSDALVYVVNAKSDSATKKLYEQLLAASENN